MFRKLKEGIVKTFVDKTKSIKERELAELLSNPDVVAHIKNLIDDSSLHRTDLEQQLIVKYIEHKNKLLSGQS